MELLQRIRLIFVAVCLTVAADLQSQSKIVNVNLAAEILLNDTIPYWQTFIVQGSIPSSATRIELLYLPNHAFDDVATDVRRTGRAVESVRALQSAGWTRDDGYEPEKQFSFEIGPLQRNTTYTFCFGIFGTTPPARQANRPRAVTLRDQRQKCKELFPSDDQPSDIRVISGVVARSSWRQHFDTDLGVMGTPTAGYLGVVTGVHFHLAPVRKDVDLFDPTVPPMQRLGRRFSVYAGISPVEIWHAADQPIQKTRLGIPVVGLGFRGPLYWQESGGTWGQVGPLMRLNTGVMFFDQDAANPLVTEPRAKRDFFVSLTADLEISSVLGPLLGVLGVK